MSITHPRTGEIHSYHQSVFQGADMTRLIRFYWVWKLWEWQGENEYVPETTVDDSLSDMAESIFAD